MKKVFSLLLALLTVSKALSFGNDELNPSTDSGTMQVRITDSETSSLGVIIEIVNVEVYNEQMGWITLNDYQQNISSVGFTNGDESLLANTTIPVGTYTKLRLTFGEANTVYTKAYNDRKTNNLWFLTDNDRQVEIAINENVTANETDDVVIDFDISTSISVLDNEYLIHPTVKEFQNPTTIAAESIADLSVLHHGTH